METVRIRVTGKEGDYTVHHILLVDGEPTSSVVLGTAETKKEVVEYIDSASYVSDIQMDTEEI